MTALRGTRTDFSLPHTQQWNFVLDFQCCESLLLELLIYQYISTFKPSLQIEKCQMRIRIIFFWLRQTRCSREGLSKGPPAFSISISGRAEILPPLLNFFFSLIYELILHYSLFPNFSQFCIFPLFPFFPTKFPCHWGAFSWFNFGMGGPGWRSSGRNLLGGALDLILVNSGSSCGWASSGTVKSVCLCGTPRWFHS